FKPAATESRRLSSIVEALPLPAGSSHANCDVPFDGTVIVDGSKRELRAAPGTQAHIYGARRVDELSWLYAPHFDGDPRARLEAIGVRLQRELVRALASPAMTSVALRTAAGELDLVGVPSLLTNRLERHGLGLLHLVAASPSHAVTARAFC